MSKNLLARQNIAMVTEKVEIVTRMEVSMTKRARGKTMAAFMLVLCRLDREMMGSRHYYDTSSSFAWMCVEALYVRADRKLSRFSRNIRQTTISRLVETCSPHVLESRSLSSERFPSLMKSAQGCLRKQSESQPTRSCLKRTKRSLLQFENVHGASSIEKLFSIAMCDLRALLELLSPG